jgi:hypothetical protein
VRLGFAACRARSRFVRRGLGLSLIKSLSDSKRSPGAKSLFFFRRFNWYEGATEGALKPLRGLFSLRCAF